MISQLSHVCIGTRNLPRLLGFYQGVLGFDVAHEFRNDQGELYGVFLSCGGRTFLEIFNDHDTPTEGGLFRHICFEVEDINTTAAQLSGYGFDADLVCGKTDRVLQIWISDPDGNKVEFREFGDLLMKFEV